MHIHRCMRCNIDFECKNEGHCSALFYVLPVINTVDGIVEHCPRFPEWDWIREYGQRIHNQWEHYNANDLYMKCWAEIPVYVDRNGKQEYYETWHCRKLDGHSGVHSHHNDCGTQGPDGSHCGLPNDHAGPCGWGENKSSVTLDK